MKRRSDPAIGDRRTLLPNWRPLLGVVLVILLTLVAGMARRTEPPKAPSDILPLVSPPILWNQILPLDPADPCLAVSGNVESRGVAVGPDENPIMVGQVANPVTTVVVAKYDHATGGRIWCTSFAVRATLGGSTFTVPLADVGGVAIDSNGEIFIGGHGRSGPVPAPTSPRPGPTNTAAPERYFVTKCSDAGLCAPTVRFVNAPVVGSHDDTIGGIAVGPDNNPVLTGFAHFAAKVPNQMRVRLLTVKVSGSTLDVLAMADAPAGPPGIRSRAAVAVDSSNNVFVTGTTTSTFKYDSLLSPIPLWTGPVAGARIALSSSDTDVALAVLGLNDEGKGSQQFVINSIDAETGATRWRKAYGIGSNDVVHDLAMDAGGNIFVVGDRSGGRIGSSPGPRDGLLVNLSPAGELKWTAVFPPNRGTGDSSQHSFSALALGSDQSPVITGDSDMQPGRSRRVMNLLKYAPQLPNGSDGQIAPDNEDKGRHKEEASLAWDEPADPAPLGFWVCIDEKVGLACQDVGLPNPRFTTATPPGSRTYSVPLSTLTSFTPHARHIVVIAYNDGGASPTSAKLSVRYSDLHKARPNR